MPRRTRDHVAAIDGGGRCDFANRAAARGGRARDGAPLFCGYGGGGIWNRAATRQEPSRARGRVDRDCAPGPSRGAGRKGWGPVRGNFLDFSSSGKNFTSCQTKV